MLYVTFKDGVDIEWHVGEETSRFTYVENNPVVELQADVDELEYIKLHFRNIPMRKDCPVVTWHGEMAQFIAENL